MASADLLPATCPVFAQTPENRAFKNPASEAEAVLETCESIIRRNLPNLLRLYLNPFVAQTCIALNELVHALWPHAERLEQFPSFLANSGDEALSGAIKLARYTVSTRTGGLPSDSSLQVALVDDADYFTDFASTAVVTRQGVTRQGVRDQIVFIPGITQLTADKLSAAMNAHGARPQFGIVVLSPTVTTNMSNELSEFLRSVRAAGGIIIACVNCEWQKPAAADLTAADPVRDAELSANDETSESESRSGSWCGVTPDIVVFDETFTRREVPFGAFASASGIYSQWTRRGMATFHSTTYQPNTISALHFLKCLEERSPEFFRSLRHRLEQVDSDPRFLRKIFRELYNPALTRLISGSGFDSACITVKGHSIYAGSRAILDGIGGVACSIRGHNPESWPSEIRSLAAEATASEIRQEVSHRLSELTGCGHHVPATSGGAAVEQALKLALIAQYPKKYVVAFRGGFSGKTLLALTGTADDTYRKNIDPLYPFVLYIDPFSADAVEQLNTIIKRYPVAVVQLELIQGVGGVREFPVDLLNRVQELRKESGALLLIDEIQTGMFRTGPFVRSAELTERPDILTIGKGTSDMMFPFALTLYTDRVHHLLEIHGTSLEKKLRAAYSFEMGYRTLLNTLRRAHRDQLSATVQAAGIRFQQALTRELSGIAMVKDIRVFGLLIGIELRLPSLLVRLAGKNSLQLYLLRMLEHRDCPLLMGFCQYDPSVLKFTPPLSVTEDEVNRVSRTISDALRASLWSLIRTGYRALQNTRSSPADCGNR